MIAVDAILHFQDKTRGFGRHGNYGTLRPRSARPGNRRTEFTDAPEGCELPREKIKA
jgi:hypothetical protein